MFFLLVKMGTFLFAVLARGMLTTQDKQNLCCQKVASGLIFDLAGMHSKLDSFFDPLWSSLLWELSYQKL